MPLSRLRRMKGSEQVAAVCFRVRDRQIEFLLVRTRAGRWIFPKGSAESGLTHAQAAALEAFEEAGVHGRMQESAFTRYVRRSENRIELVVHAHLCEVTWLDSAPEADRDPTWFPLKKAKQLLRQDRPGDFGDDLARVLDCAVEHLRGMRARRPTLIDAEQKMVLIDGGHSLSKSNKRLR